MNDAAKLTKLALLIDGDNVGAAFMPYIMQEAEKLGVVATRRIYGQFSAGKMKSWSKRIAEFDLVEVDVIPVRKGKNATDIRLAIDAAGLLIGRGLDGICIASSDSDFKPLADRIRAESVDAYGFGLKTLPKAYKDAFDRFIPLETKKPSQKGKVGSRSASAAKVNPATTAKAPPPKSGPRREGQTPTVQSAGSIGKLLPVNLNEKINGIPIKEIHSAIDKIKGKKDGWSHARDVGNELIKAGYSPKQHKYKVASLLQKVPGLAVEKRGSHTYVRVRPT
jgi:hypothetical protein